MTSADCAEFEDVAAELALGTLTGRERASALAHLQSCIDCRRRLDNLTHAADMLLFLTPDTEAPAGFAGRVVARIDRLTQRPRRHKLTGIGAAAAAVLLVAGIGLAATREPPHTRTASAPKPLPASDVHVARLTPARGQHVDGQVFSHTGNQAWIFLTVHDTDATETYTCELDFTDGTHLTAGSFHLHDGAGGWGRSLDLHNNQITTVRLRTPNGDTEATARIGGR